MEEFFLIQTEDFQLTQIDFFVRMMISVGIGFLIGLEREHASGQEKVEKFAGIRTFVFVVLFGFLATFLGLYFTHLMILGGLVATIIIVAISYWVSAHQGQIGGTTEFATLIAFLLGCTTFLGFIEASLAITVVLLVLLSLKVKLQSIVGRITQDEMVAFIKFVVLALLIFPFLPDQTYGPYNVFNPRELGWVIVLTSGIGVVGYALMKFLGSGRGILLTGIVGGLVSSTVVTWVFSKKSQEVPELSRNCAVAILAASTIMVIRVIVWVVIFNQDLLARLTVPMTLIFLAGLGVAIYYHKKQASTPRVETEVPLGEPLNLKEAVIFGLIYSVILIVVSYANSQFGTKGIYVSSAIAGLTDIDAITISMSKLAGDSIIALTAQNAILLATLCNTIVKIGIALWAGSKSLRRYILVGYGLMFVAGIIGFFVLNS